MKHLKPIFAILLVAGTLAAQSKSAFSDPSTDRKSGIQLVQVKVGVWYSLVAENSGKALEVIDDVDGSAVQQDAPTGANNQLFQFQQVQSGWFKIVAKSDGKALEIRDASILDHAPVQQNAVDGQDNQLFALVQDTDGSFTVMSKISGYCFDIAGGEKSIQDRIPVIVYPAGNAKNHKFRLIEKGAAS